MGCGLLNNCNLKLHKVTVYKNYVKNAYRNRAIRTPDQKIINWDLRRLKWDPEPTFIRIL